MSRPSTILAAAERGNFTNYSYWGSTVRAFLRNPVAVFFLALLVAVLAFTFIEPLLPYAPEVNTIYRGDTNLPPSSQYWFGTNSIGQDLWRPDLVGHPHLAADRLCRRLRRGRARRCDGGIVGVCAQARLPVHRNLQHL